jgi:hypothetical protein
MRWGGTDMQTYYPERAAYEKIAEARAAAARDRLAAIAERVGCKARQTAGPPLTRLMQRLASNVQGGGHVLDGRVPVEGDPVHVGDTDGDESR